MMDNITQVASGMYTRTPLPPKLKSLAAGQLRPAAEHQQAPYDGQQRGKPTIARPMSPRFTVSYLLS